MKRPAPQRSRHGRVDFLARCFVGAALGSICGCVLGAMLGVCVAFAMDPSDEYGAVYGIALGGYGAVAGGLGLLLWFALDLPVMSRRRQRSHAWAGMPGPDSARQ